MSSRGDLQTLSSLAQMACEKAVQHAEKQLNNYVIFVTKMEDIEIVPGKRLGKENVDRILCES